MLDFAGSAGGLNVKSLSANDLAPADDCVVLPMVFGWVQVGLKHGGLSVSGALFFVGFAFDVAGLGLLLCDFPTSPFILLRRCMMAVVVFLLSAIPSSNHL